MAKKQQHFKPACLIGCVRSAPTELTASGVTKRVTASLVPKPLFGDRNALSKRDYTRGAGKICFEICIERIDFSDGERLGGKHYLQRGCWLDGFLGLADLLLVIDGEQQELAERVTPMIALPRK